MGRDVWPSAVFAYGTLMPGHLRWPELEPHAVGYREAKVRGVLYDSGLGWPAATFPPDAPTFVPGMVIDLATDGIEQVLAHLDLVEDVPGGLFARVVVTSEDGDRAWAWSHQGPVDHMRVVDAWTDQPEA